MFKFCPISFEIFEMIFWFVVFDNFSKSKSFIARSFSLSDLIRTGNDLQKTWIHKDSVLEKCFQSIEKPHLWLALMSSSFYHFFWSPRVNLFLFQMLVQPFLALNCWADDRQLKIILSHDFISIMWS